MSQVLAVLLLLACSPDDPAAADSGALGGADGGADGATLQPPPPGQGFQMSMTTVAPAYTEVWVCEVYPIPIDATANVNRVEYEQTPGTHHMTLSTPGLVATDLAPGTYDCDALYQDVLMESQIMFFGSQGEATGDLSLPTGVAAQMPPNLTVVHEIHYVNTTDSDIELYSRVNGWTIDDAEVVDGIWGGSVRDEHINLPAGQRTTEWSRCVMNRDVEVQFLASHMHALGVEFTIASFDGTTTGEVFYRNDDWHDPRIIQSDPPLVVPEGQGFEWSCTWENDNPTAVTYGLTAADEMCNLAMVFTPFDVTAQCEVVETSDGVLWVP